MSLSLRIAGLLALLCLPAVAELPLLEPAKPSPAILRTLGDEPFRVPAQISSIFATRDGRTVFALHENEDRLSVLDGASGRALGQLQIVRSSFDLSRSGTRVCGVHGGDDHPTDARAKFAVWSWPARAEIWSKEMKRALLSAFSPDGSRVAVLTMDKLGTFQPGYEVVVFDAATGQERWRKTIEQTEPGSFDKSLAFLDERRLFVSVSKTAQPLWIFDARTGDLAAPIPDLEDGELQFAPAASAPVLLAYNTLAYWVVRADAKGALQVISKGAARSDEPLQNFRGGALSPDGRLVLMATAEECRIYRAGDGSQAGSIPTHGEHAAFFADGKNALVSFDHTLTVVPTGTWRAAVYPGLRSHATRINRVRFSPDGKLLASNDGDDIFLWDVATGAAVAHLRPPKPGHDLLSFAFDPGRPLFFGNTGAEMWWWDISKLSAAGSGLPGEAAEPAHQRLMHMAEPPANFNGAEIAFDRAGKFMVRTANVFVTVLQMDAKREDLVDKIRELKLAGWERYDPVRQLALSADGQHALFGGLHFVRIYDLASDQLVREDKARSPVLSPDGRLYAEPPEGQVFDTLVHDAETGAVVATLPFAEGQANMFVRIVRIAFSPDGSRLAAAVNNLNEGLGYAVWDTKTGKRLGFIATHRGRSVAFAFNPQATQLAAANADGSIDLWDLGQAFK